MNQTIRTEAADRSRELTLDELVALSLTRSELDTVAAYQWATGMSILTLAAKIGRGRA